MYEFTFSKVHRAIIRSPKVLNVLGDKLAIGQRVFISGELQAQNFLNNENQQRQTFQIRVNELYATRTANDANDAESKKNIDHNSVCVLSYVASDVIHHENFSVFNMVSYYVSRYSEKPR